MSGLLSAFAVETGVSGDEARHLGLTLAIVQALSIRLPRLLASRHGHVSHEDLFAVVANTISSAALAWGAPEFRADFGSAGGSALRNLVLLLWSLALLPVAAGIGRVKFNRSTEWLIEVGVDSVRSVDPNHKERVFSKADVVSVDVLRGSGEIDVTLKDGTRLFLPALGPEGELVNAIRDRG